MVNDNSYRTIDIERKGYGKRYTWLPVDALTREGFAIDCTNGYIRPSMIDIRPGDLARWRENGRVIQATVTQVRREGNQLEAEMEHAALLPEDEFYP